MADFTKQELETMLKDTEEHLAETKMMGPGYYKIRERYDYAVEADERYIEKLKKQIAEYDQIKHAKGLLEIMPPKIGWSVDFSQPFGTQSVNNTEWECPKFDTEGKNDMQVPIRINPKNSGGKFR